MSYDTFSARVHAVLDHDGIHPKRKAGHLVRTCGISESTARTLLAGKATSRCGIYIKLVKGLDVDFLWMLEGTPEKWHPRTWRILIEHIKGFPPADAARIMHLITGCIMGHVKATNLLNLASTGKLSYTAAAQLL
ncbi:MAG: hypothetical protein ABIT70_03455 [Sulfuriferula sp.]